jgi:hypothetical protein
MAQSRGDAAIPIVPPVLQINALDVVCFLCENITATIATIAPLHPPTHTESYST